MAGAVITFLAELVGLLIGRPPATTVIEYDETTFDRAGLPLT